MCSSVVREGCREAALHGGCGILAVEAMDGAWPLAVRCPAPAQPAQPMQFANHAERRLPSGMLPRTNPPIQERPIHHTLPVHLLYSHVPVTW
jgi:hypothetical protein